MTLRGGMIRQGISGNLHRIRFHPAYALFPAKTADLTFRTETEETEANGLAVLTGTPFSAACASTYLT